MASQRVPADREPDRDAKAEREHKLATLREVVDDLAAQNGPVTEDELQTVREEWLG
jgi:hypothetical protein